METEESNTEPETPEPVISSSRWSNVLIALATVLAIVSVFSVWAKTQVLDSDEWVGLSSELLVDPDIQDALAKYLVEQVYADGQVSSGLEEILPEDLSGLAGPLAGAVRGPLTDGVQGLLASERFQSIWDTANRTAHESLVSVLRGEDVVGLSTSDGEVALELRELVVAVGETIGLSQDRLDAIAPDAGRIVIVESGELGAVQDLVATLEFLAWLLFVLVVALFALAVYIARGRRFTALRNVGLGVMFVGIVVIAARGIAIRVLIGALADNPPGRPVVDAVVTIGTGLLGRQGWSALFAGLMIAGFAALMGDRKLAVSSRRLLAPAFGASSGAFVGGAAVLLLGLIWWSPGRVFDGWTTGLLLAALVIAALVSLRNRTQREFPDMTITEAIGRSDASSIS